MTWTKEYKTNYYKKYPWIKVYENIKSRCNCKGQRYHKKGRKTSLTKEQVEFLWFRDKAYLMKKPSIDRIDNTKDYEIDNCRFIEWIENMKGTNFYK